jgi:hypothetical protein
LDGSARLAPPSRLKSDSRRVLRSCAGSSKTQYIYRWHSEHIIRSVSGYWSKSWRLLHYIFRLHLSTHKVESTRSSQLIQAARQSADPAGTDKIRAWYWTSPRNFPQDSFQDRSHVITVIFRPEAMSEAADFCGLSITADQLWWQMERRIEMLEKVEVSQGSASVGVDAGGGAVIWSFVVCD